MTSTLQLQDKPTLKDFQEYVARMVEERGFADESISEVFMLFLEECGELAKAARKSAGLKTDAASASHDIALEAADVFIYLLDICNHYHINLETAFRAKEELNKTRVWG